MTRFESLLTAWDGEQVAVRYEADLDTWMFIGVHSTRRGPAGGGTRMRSYASPEDALADVLELYADGDGSPSRAADRLVERRLRA